MVRKIFSISIIVIMMVSTICVRAEEYDKSSEKKAYDVKTMSNWGSELYGDLYYYIESENTISISGCVDNVEEITIPESINGIPVTAIAYSAFYGQTALRKIYIPDSVTEIGIRAFGDCKSLTSIEIAPDSSEYKLIDGVLYNNDLTELVLAPRNISGEYTIPDGIKTICSAAFDCCYNLTAVNFPQGIQELKPLAFSDCKKLQQLDIPFTTYSDDGIGISSIDEQAFYGCSSLTRVSIPITYSFYQYRRFIIYDRAFQDCTNLKEIYLPYAAAVYSDAFQGCANLRNIYFEGNESDWEDASSLQDDFLDQVTVICNYAPYTPVTGDNYILDLERNGDIIKVYVEGNEPIYGGQTLFVVQYDKQGRFLDYVTAIVGYGEGGTYANFDFELDEVSMIKAFIWNNIGSMMPASNIVSLNL